MGTRLQLRAMATWAVRWRDLCSMWDGTAGWPGLTATGNGHHPGPGWPLELICGLPEPHTVRALILSSFDFVVTAFTAPVRTPLTPTAAQERMAGAPSGKATHTRVGGSNFFAVPMTNGVAQRSKASWRARR